jgi:transposase InsO family protein
MIITIQQGTGHGIRRICAVLQVPRSSYYHAQRPTARQLEDRDLGDQIERVFKAHKRRYGYRRIGCELAEEGISCSPERVRRLMHERNLSAVRPKTFVPRTSDGRADAPSPNLLSSQQMPAEPNQVLAGDITHIPTANGWLYLAVVIDLCSRKIVGWKLAHHMRAELVTEALREAVVTQSVAPGAIFHSDRGSQYGSRTFRQLLHTTGMKQSMSRRANPYDNAWSESVIGTLKNELLQGGRFHDEHDARIELFSYIDGYYNTRRKHSSINYLSPVQFESNFYKN